MGAPKNLQPQVPGAQPQPDLQDPANTPAADPALPPDREFAPEQTVDAEALAAENLQLKAELAKYRSAQAGDSHLPDQSEVDAKAIKRAVLTKQGWVAPIETKIRGML